MNKQKKARSLLWQITHRAEVAAIQAAIAQHGTRQSAAQSLGITTMTLRTILGK